MEIVRSALAIILLSITLYTSAHASLAAETTPEQPRTFGILEGSWEGSFEAKSPTSEGHLISSQVTIRLVFENGVAHIFSGQGGQWNEVEPGRFKVEFLGTNALVYLVHAGRIPTPEGSRWFETYLIAVAARTEDSLLGRWVRVVNHPDTAIDDPERAFTVDGEMILKKVGSTGGG